MDRKIKKYQSILLGLLQEYAAERQATQTSLRSSVLADKENGQFQVVTTGWYEGKFYHSVMFHFEVKPDGKIWLLRNTTDIPIAEELAERGIPKTDIVLGFQPENLRRYSGFAVA